MNKKICVIGLGYIGLPTATIFAKAGFEVIGFDTNEKIRQNVNRGVSLIVEPGLDEMLSEVVNQGNLIASDEIPEADVYIVAVPTPFDHAQKKADLKYLNNVCDTLAPKLSPGSLIILESTCPVGTTREITRKLSNLRLDLKFADSEDSRSVNICYCPERVLPGNLIAEFTSNDRVIGGMTRLCSEKASAIYSEVVQGQLLVCSSPETAEMVKLTENSFRDVNIAFANELSILCDDNGVNVWELIELANRHPRVNILEPGPGVGGHCIAVDPLFLISEHRCDAKIISAARSVNDHKPAWVIEKSTNLIERYPESRIVCFGAAFKPNIDDFRESPAKYIVESLHERYKERVVLVEPYLSEAKFGNIRCIEISDVNYQEDICIMLVNHDCFLEQKHKPKVFFDTKNVW